MLSSRFFMKSVRIKFKTTDKKTSAVRIKSAFAKNLRCYLRLVINVTGTAISKIRVGTRYSIYLSTSRQELPVQNHF